MSKAVEPKKLKVYLTKLRELLPPSPSSDGNEDTSAKGKEDDDARETLHKCYKLLLLTELAQRGAIYPMLLPADDDDDNKKKEKEEKLLNAIQSVAGRSLVDEQQPAVPKPLVAGCAVVCAMIAETCADYALLLHQQQTEQETIPLMNVTNELFQQTLIRCKEVQDDRLHALLQISSSSYHEHFFKISYGHYLRAANHGKIDAPPMWKKSLDVALKYHSVSILIAKKEEEEQKEETAEEYELYQHKYVITPLLHLSGIAAQRNNVKRSHELNLYLILAYLSLLQDNDITDTTAVNSSENAVAYSSSSSAKKEKSTKEIIEECFISPHDESTLFLPAKKTAATMSAITIKQCILEKAQEIASTFCVAPSPPPTNLSSSSSESSPISSLTLLHSILLLELDMQDESLQIEKIAVEEYEKAKNRLGIDSASSSDSIGTKKKPAFKTATKTTTTATANKKEALKTMKGYQEEAVLTLYSQIIDAEDEEDSEAAPKMEGNAMRLLQLVLSSWKTTSATAYVATTTMTKEGEEPSSFSNTSTFLQKMATESIILYLQRFITRARAASLHYNRISSKKQKQAKQRPTKTFTKKQWSKMISFIQPFLQKCKEGIVDTNNGENLPCVIIDNDGSKKIQRFVNLIEEDTALSYLTSCLSNSQRKLLDWMAGAVMMYYWMMEGYGTDGGGIYNSSHCCIEGEKKTDEEEEILQYHDVLLLSYLLLSVMNMIRIREEERIAPDDGVIGTKRKDELSIEEKQAVMQSKCALLACQYRIGLILSSSATEGGDEEEKGKLILREFMLEQQQKEEKKSQATTKKDQKQQQEKEASEYITSLMGIQYLHFLLSWSGLHSSPWTTISSHGTTTDSQRLRFVVERAKRNLALSRQNHGRGEGGRGHDNWMEDYFIQIGTADVESSGINNGGGFANVGIECHQMILTKLEEEEEEEANDKQEQEGATQDVSNYFIKALFRSHCLLGLSKIIMFSRSSNDEGTAAEDYARQSLKIMQSIPSISSLSDKDGSSTFYLYRNHLHSFSSASLFHLSTSRRLVAESLLRSSNPREACNFLRDAAKDSPKDYDVNFALGVFRLRMYLHYSGSEAKEEAKEAQMQLLRAAKLDTKKADPFALLGLWYEVKGDVKRASGCFSKALALDASHPVAGRGALRLNPTMDDPVKQLCELATKRTTGGGACGWAYVALGRHMVLVDGNDEGAIVFLQKALRCSDVENPDDEFLGVFYSDPTKRNVVNCQEECGNVWSELASCYCRLGKYSAAVRAYRSLYEVVGEERIRPDVLCAWAQVELDLGLYDEAVSKFEKVLATIDATISSTSHLIAAHGQGAAMLALAQRDVGEGKFGMALAHLKRGIDSLVSGLLLSSQNNDSNDEKEVGLRSDFACALKLLGDIYSFGASLPPGIFKDVSYSTSNDNATSMMDCSKAQIAFVSKGEEAYRCVVEMIKENIELRKGKEQEDNDAELVSAAAKYDVGVNLLWQGRLLCAYLGEGSGGGTDTTTMGLAAKHSEVKNLFQHSVDYFLQSIDESPTFATAWCGLGCALMATDPLLSQHAFCRALQLDKSLPDAWANLGLLYAEYGSSDAADEAMDALTQVADSPLMWIGRGMLLENMYSSRPALDEAEAKIAEASLCRAADAYRAALQVAQHPFALLGLSLTSRRLGLQESLIKRDHAYCNAAERLAKIESRASMSIFLQSTGGQNIGAKILGDVMKVEEILELSTLGKRNMTDNDDYIKEIKMRLSQLNIDNNNETDSSENKSFKKKWKTVDRSSLTLDDAIKLAHNAADAVQSKKQHEVSVRHLEPLAERDSLSLVQKLVHENPDRGDLWLQFAKELAKEVTSEDCSTNESRQMYEAALVATMSAANKAYSLMQDQVVNVRSLVPRRQGEKTGSGKTSRQEHNDFSHKPVVPEAVDASLVAECMALISWLNEMQRNDDDEENSPMSTSIELQRALILDPENSLARAGLGDQQT